MLMNYVQKLAGRLFQWANRVLGFHRATLVALSFMTATTSVGFQPGCGYQPADQTGETPDRPDVAIASDVWENTVERDTGFSNDFSDGADQRAEPFGDSVEVADDACITVTDEQNGIDFGERFIGETHERMITIANCGTEQWLEVYDVSLGHSPENQGVDRFSLTYVPRLPEPILIGPAQTTSFVLSYTPISYSVTTHPELCDVDPCRIPDQAVLTITSNDPMKTSLDIDVRGIGSTNHCPIAVAHGRIFETTDWNTERSDSFGARPMDVLELNATASHDAEGQISGYQWDVTLPPGAQPSLSPSAESPIPFFDLDVVGEYSFSLRVYDEQGVESCIPDEFHVFVAPEETIYVELVWDTPGDPTNTDTGPGRGSDLDLHFLHPLGQWNNPADASWASGDCHWKNKEPNWGDLSSTSDDPRFVREDYDGWGPEMITLNQPESDADAPMTYSVGVYYFAAHGYGESDATVRLYVHGDLSFESTVTALAPCEFWDVARIEWPSEIVTDIDVVYPNGFP